MKTKKTKTDSVDAGTKVLLLFLQIVVKEILEESKTDTQLRDQLEEFSEKFRKLSRDVYFLNNVAAQKTYKKALKFLEKNKINARYNDGWMD